MKNASHYARSELPRRFAGEQSMKTSSGFPDSHPAGGSPAANVCEADALTRELRTRVCDVTQSIPVEGRGDSLDLHADVVRIRIMQ